MNELSKKITEVLERAVENQEMAGANALVMQNGEEAAYGQAGFRDREERKPYERDTIARIYSMTKPVTATAAMLLLERGLLDLNAPVEEFLPGFHNPMVERNGGLVPANRPVRVCELLNMTSGLVYGGNPASLSSVKTEELFTEIKGKMGGDSPLSTMEIANRLGQCPMKFHPGESFEYGTSADVMGAVIEVVSGQRLGEFLERELFAPLGMRDTGFYVPRDKQSRLAKVYEKIPGSMKLYTENHLGISNSMEQPPAFESGGAGLACTTADYAKFAGMLLENGSYEGKRYLAPRTVRYLREKQLMPWQQEEMSRTWTGIEGYSYGNFMRVLKHPAMAAGLGTEGEYGWDGWLGPYFCNSPKDNLTLLLSLQLKDAGTTETTRKVRNLVWSALC